MPISISNWQWRRWCLLAVTLLLAGCTWTVNGSVTDAQGKGLADVLVEWLVDDVVVKTARTDTSGRIQELVFEADARPGVRLSKAGYASQTVVPDVSVNLQSFVKRAFFARFDVKLQPGPASLVQYSGAPSESLPSEAAEKQALAMGLPSLDRSASILGPDANTNGIRDDIEAWIAARNDRTAEQKAAMRQYARASQAELAAERTPQAALAAVLVAGRAHNCLHARSANFDDYVQTSRAIRDYTYNTIERVRATTAIDRLLGGQSWSLASGDTCEPAP